MSELKQWDILWQMRGHEQNGVYKFYPCPMCIDYIDERKIMFTDGCGGSINNLGKQWFYTRKEAVSEFLKKHESLEMKMPDLEEFEKKLVVHEERTDFQDEEITEFDTVTCSTVYMGGLDRLVKANDMLKWHEEYAEWAYMNLKSLTLSEIYEQLKDKMKDRIITVFVDSSLNGVIYQCGNYEEGKWVKYGETRGYA